MTETEKAALNFLNDILEFLCVVSGKEESFADDTNSITDVPYNFPTVLLVSLGKVESFKH